jgi:phytoene synthase
VFEALARTREHFGLPLSLFEDLLSAFRQDVVKHRYESWAEVLEYCRRSANPVGRLVLRVAGHVEPHADAWSDAVCTALQLTNFWQDLADDWARGRLYVPRELWQAYGADPADLDRRIVTPAWRMVLSETARRTRGLFIEGAPVCEVVSGRLRYELRATVHGGLRILDKLERAGFDMFRRRPALRATDAMVIGWKALIQWPATPRSTTPS